MSTPFAGFGIATRRLNAANLAGQAVFHLAAAAFRALSEAPRRLRS